MLKYFFLKDSFNSLRALVNYKKRSSPYKLDFVLNAQNSLHESRTVVYDSVGIGFGHYRYDKSLNEYIRDQNGNYIAHTIFRNIKLRRAHVPPLC